MGLSIRFSISSIICFFFSLYFFSIAQSFDGSSLAESLDNILHHHAFKILFHGRPRTGTLYNASLPHNLAGMNISVVRLRSRTLWRLGANFSHFSIPPATLPIPHVKRLLIVYYDLGSYWSSYYFNVSGYTLLTTVIGFEIFDASNSWGKDLMKLDLDTMGKHIVIQFQNSTVLGLENKESAAKCATFGANGKVDLSEVRMWSVCYSTTGQGHFSIVSPSPSPLKKKQQKIRIWGFWVMGFALGVFILLFVGLIATVVFKARTVKRAHEMEIEAEEGEVLNTFWIDSSKMPCATVTRTYPALESCVLP